MYLPSVFNLWHDIEGNPQVSSVNGVPVILDLKKKNV